MASDSSLHDSFRNLITRVQSAGQTPVALYGAGQLFRRLSPPTYAPAGVIDCVIDDNPDRQGCSIGGLPVVSLDQAVARGVRAVIITAEGAVQDAIWSKRHAIRQRGLYLLTCPGRFTPKPWDDCLIDQLEATMAISAGIKPLYTHSYPDLNHLAHPALASIYTAELARATARRGVVGGGGGER